MTLYHATSARAAVAILRDGFRDARGSYGFATIELEGVFFSDSPLDENEGAASSEVVLAIDLDETVIGDYELVGGAYREWCLPSRLANASTVRRLPEDEVDAAQTF